MARSNRFPEPFDRDREFIALKSFTIDGKPYDPGSTIDKTRLTTRRLRQLYESSRYIKMIDAQVQSNESGMPEFANFPNEVIIDWLSSHGKIPRLGTNHEKLVQKAIDIWNLKFGNKEEVPVKPKLVGLPPDLDKMNWFMLRDIVKEQTGVWPKNKVHATELLGYEAVA